ncbi:YaiO family outer membrane beta-barrel protein [Marivirga salinae]|uniref:YaiO family outer membrane beta-barrel protein n=1 Tax=Marivirga salinarum TaxID=3059078 RepID=A0AA49GCR9_9BACT|nr:YaiO family outer membrane beta-barrel protein [Marivirga sp. BDSF4-3]WKK78552.2 YaiO family outer membrane beta-barrel protein [Marivirga sp. BDSF4-3]
MKNPLVLLLVFLLISCNSWAQKENRENSIAASYQRDFFDRDFNDWNQFSLSLKSDGPKYVWIPQIQLVNRFSLSDIAGQLSIYRKFKNKDYALLEGGLSEGRIMSKNHLRFIYYHTAGLWEVNAGFHYLVFPDNSQFFGPQIGLSRYIGNFLGNFTAQYFWDSQNEWPNNYSLQHSWRYYLQGKSHLSVSGSYGYDNSLVIISDQLNSTTNNPYLWNIGTYFQSKFYGRTAFRLSYVYARYQLELFERNQHSIQLSFEFKRYKDGK